jgi:hypothetical protein
MMFVSLLSLFFFLSRPFYVIPGKYCNDVDMRPWQLLCDQVISGEWGFHFRCNLSSYS